MLDTYVAAMNLQMHLEADIVKQKFSDTASGMSYEDLLKLNAGQKVIHDELLRHPDQLLQQLSLGYIRMIDESYIQTKLKEKHRSRERTYQKDEGELFLRAGEVNLNVDKAHHSIGQWGYPDLSFPGFELVAGGVNTPVLEHLHGASVDGLPIMARFNFYAASPYTVWGHRDGFDLSFARDPEGRFYIPNAGDHKEWLASYFTRKTEEHSDSEREQYAPKGAEKLYNALKDKRVTKVRHVDLHEIEDFGD
jgi:hypothetical protein